jgi:hypothetical protein
MSAALTKKQVLNDGKFGGRVMGIVKIPLVDLLYINPNDYAKDVDRQMEMQLSEVLTGHPDLREVEYEIKGCEPGHIDHVDLIIEVSGNPSEIIADWTGAEDDE